MPAIRTAKRKEQSRSAAKTRRLTETEVFVELASCLPGVGQQTVYQADRIGLLRLTTMLYRTRRLMSKLHPVKETNVHADDETYYDEASVSKCLDGFVIIVNKNGQLLYVSSGASSCIGFTQIDLAGKSLRDYVHKDDWNRLCQQMRMHPDQASSAGGNDNTATNSDNSKIFFRMKTAMTPRGGRARKLTMAVYQPLHADIIDPSETFQGPPTDDDSPSPDEDIRILFCIPFSLAPLQKPLSSVGDSPSALSSRHDIAMRFRSCSDKLATALEYANGKQLTNQSFYDLVYPEDLMYLAKEFRQVYKDGHVTTPYYRLSTKSGGYVWAMTEAAFLVQNIRGVTQTSVLCNHYVLSSNANLSTNEDRWNVERLNVALAPSSGRTAAAINCPPTNSTTQVLSSMKTAPQFTRPSIIVPLAQANPETHNRQQNLSDVLQEHRMKDYPIPQSDIEKYGLFCLSSATAKAFDLNNLLMAAMGSTFPFAGSMQHAAKSFPLSSMPVFNFNRSMLGSPINPSPDFSSLFVNATTAAMTCPTRCWTSAFAARFPPYHGASVIGEQANSATSVHTGIKRHNRLDAKTIEAFEKDIIQQDGESKKDETGRRHRLDAKTIEAFEVAMIKNELTTGNE